MSKNYYLSILALILAANLGFAQPIQHKKFKSHINIEHLNKFSKHHTLLYHKQRKKAYNYAQTHNIPTIKIDERGHKSFLFKMDDHGNLLYITTYNVKASQTIGTNELYSGGNLGLQLDGKGMTAGLWDQNWPRGTHELLSGKVDYMDTGGGVSGHSTHVAGTMVGKKFSSGPGKNARGMAYKAHLKVYDWENDIAEMATAAANGLLVSNHSYGLDLSSLTSPKTVLGRYDNVSAGTDNVAYNAPYYSIVVAAGNSRNDGINTSENGYNLLGGWMTTAKNTIVVAAVKNVANYTGPSSVYMTSFSSWGPTSDNRIKPDISAPGYQIYSSVVTSTSISDTTSYGYMSGTSMATPTVSGSILLLQELSHNLTNNYLRAATIKALIIETALETGDNPGPDPKFGWGLLNIEGAAQLILDSNNKAGSFYKELTLNNKATYSKTITANGDDLKVTIAWTDPPKDPDALFQPILTNDLDLRITDSQGNTYYPWRLDPSSYSKPALNNGDNDVDNVEQVVVPNAVAGETYTIKVTHKGSLKNNAQDFSMAVLGSKPLAVDDHQLTNVSIYPNPVSDQLNLHLKKTGHKVNVTVFDITGRKVMGKHFENTSGDFALNVSNLTSGIYFVKIVTNGKSATKKLIVK